MLVPGGWEDYVARLTVRPEGDEAATPPLDELRTRVVDDRDQGWHRSSHDDAMYRADFAEKRGLEPPVVRPARRPAEPDPSRRPRASLGRLADVGISMRPERLTPSRPASSPSPPTSPASAPASTARHRRHHRPHRLLGHHRRRELAQAPRPNAQGPGRPRAVPRRGALRRLRRDTGPQRPGGAGRQLPTEPTAHCAEVPTLPVPRRSNRRRLVLLRVVRRRGRPARCLAEEQRLEWHPLLSHSVQRLAPAPTQASSGARSRGAWRGRGARLRPVKSTAHLGVLVGIETWLHQGVSSLPRSVTRDRDAPW